MNNCKHKMRDVMSATPGRDSLGEGYRRLSEDPEYQATRRKFTQADLDRAHEHGRELGWLEGYESGLWGGQHLD